MTKVNTPEEEFQTAKVGKSGQQLRFTIPKEIREEMNIKKGDIFAIKTEVEDGERIIKIKKMKDPFVKKPF